MTNTIDFKQVEKNARLREIESSKILSEEEMYLANDLQAKANSKGMKLVPERKIKNNFRFAQFIQANWSYLRDIKYLTSAEKTFLIDILSNIGFLSNCIVDDVQKKNPTPLNQQAIADLLGTYKPNVSRTVKKLVDKGVLCKAELGLEENNARAYSLFVNPNIIFSGNKDEVNQTLQAMFSKVPKELKKLPQRLF